MASSVPVDFKWLSGSWNSTDAGGSSRSDASASSVSEDPARELRLRPSGDVVSEKDCDAVRHGVHGTMHLNAQTAFPRTPTQRVNFHRAGNEHLAGVGQSDISVENLIESVQRLLSTVSDVSVANAPANTYSEDLPVGVSFMHALASAANERTRVEPLSHKLMPQKVGTTGLVSVGNHGDRPHGMAAQAPRRRRRGAKSQHQKAQFQEESQQPKRPFPEQPQRQNSDAHAPQTDQGPEKFRQEFVKTRLCCFELMGCCQKGTQCPFAHGAKDLRGCPDLTKTSICHKWTRGCCPLPAERCRYAHGASDRN